MDLYRSSPEPSADTELHRYLELAAGRISLHFGATGADGEADRPMLVFLHEALGCHDMWKGVPATLSAVTGLSYLTYDRLGHGRSGSLAGRRDEKYLEVEAFEILPAVLEACRIVEPVLVGHSDGGTIALMYASRHPVRAVVTEAAHVFVEEATLAGIRAAVEAWRTTDLRARLARYHGAKTDALFDAWAATWLSDRFRAWNVEHMLPGITAPVLVVQGDDDEYGTVRQVEAIAAGTSGPAQSMLVAGCRHVPHLQAADRVLPEVARFIGDLPRR